ncbi:MAG TPA: sn-glycerol-3-phosphate ABC transporter ATP-binding protein UgpC [Actinomycetota bacterium]|nr:sn-glycerol-3-phosphate ABC transporter ATP-binding protein UgpC [Actinomycetota bacterium]
MAEITLEDVTKVYPDGTRAVSSVNLEIQDGEFMVLVGPSGCGKTTALRMVAGLEDITEGVIKIGERVVNDVPPKDRDVAMVFQNYALYPHLSVYENMAFGLRLRKVPKQEIDRRVREAARILGLEEFLNRKPRALSGGQRQRVAMGRAIVREPQAFLMDEPLSNLDAKLRVQMRAEIAKLQRDLGVTTIYVTHDQTEAMTMGDRVAVMRKGLLQQVDAPQALYDRPVNLFVAGFIGSPAMNMVEAELARADGGLFASFGGFRLRVPEETVAERPALRRYEGRRVVLGIRPEDMEDASLVSEAPEDRRLSAVVDLREALGSQIIVHFTVQAPPVLTEDVRELATDVGADALAELEQTAKTGISTFVAALNPRTRAREGERLELVVDTRRLHFFDPETGLGIYSDDQR